MINMSVVKIALKRIIVQIKYGAYAKTVRMELNARFVELGINNTPTI